MNKMDSVEKQVANVSLQFIRFSHDLGEIKGEIHPIRQYYDDMMTCIDGFVVQLLRVQDEQTSFREAASRLTRGFEKMSVRTSKLEARLEPA